MKKWQIPGEKNLKTKAKGSARKLNLKYKQNKTKKVEESKEEKLKKKQTLSWCQWQHRGLRQRLPPSTYRPSPGADNGVNIVFEPCVAPCFRNHNVLDCQESSEPNASSAVMQALNYAGETRGTRAGVVLLASCLLVKNNPSVRGKHWHLSALCFSPEFAVSLSR